MLKRISYELESKLYGKSIPGSNIIDLVNDVIRHRKGSEPTGWQAFADMNIPQDVIGNRERWDWMHRAPETPETDYITPKQKRTIRKTASHIQVCKEFECQKTYQRPFFIPCTFTCHQITYKRKVFFSMDQLQ